MKRIYFLLCLGVALCIPAFATPVPLVYVTINNATNTVASMQAFLYNPQLQNATITHGALTSTNELKIDIYSVYQGATTNGRVYVGTWYPSNTNAATEIVNGNSYTITNFLSLDIGTTNAVTISGTYGN
jgi:hypothetical protein